MLKYLFRFVWSLSLICSLGQGKVAHPEFEVASIRPSAPEDSRVNVGMHVDGAQARFSFLSLRDCMRIAYGMKNYQLIGPNWMASDHFNISAKLPEGAGQDQVHLMLQNLMARRFRMITHRERRDFSGFALEPGKSGLRLKEVVAEEPSRSMLDVKATASAAGLYIDPGNGSYFTFVDNHLIGHTLPIWRIADMPGNPMDKPVVDMTGMNAVTLYDLSLEITADDYRTMQIRGALKSGMRLTPEVAQLAEASTESLTSALEGAGLRLEARKALLDVIVIDSAQRTPTEN